MQASIVRAADERELLDILDQVDTPTACTWEVYDGPLWLDVDLNLDVEVEEVEGARHVSPDRVRLGGLERLQEDLLSLSQPYCDATAEMTEAILSGAFPQTWVAITRHWKQTEGRGEDAPTFAERPLREAVAADIDQHRARIADKTVAFDEDGALIPAQVWLFRRTRRGGFERVPAEAFEAFIHGEGLLPAERDGLVRVVRVSVVLHEGQPVDFSIEDGLQLRVDDRGFVIPAHRADAFGVGDAEPASPIEARRNAAVQWTLSESEEFKLDAVLEKLMLRHTHVEDFDLDF